MQRPSVWLSGDELSGAKRLPPVCVVCGEPAQLCKTPLSRKPPLFPSSVHFFVRIGVMRVVLPLCAAHVNYFNTPLSKIDRAVRWGLLAILLCLLTLLTEKLVRLSGYYPSLPPVVGLIEPALGWAFVVMLLAIGLLRLWKTMLPAEGVYTEDIKSDGSLQLHNVSPQFADGLAAVHADSEPPAEWRDRLNQGWESKINATDDKTSPHDVQRREGVCDNESP